MGLFDSLKNMFAHHEHHHGASIGQPHTLTDTKAVLAFIVLHQHLADMRKVAEAVLAAGRDVVVITVGASPLKQLAGRAGVRVVVGGTGDISTARGAAMAR